MGNLQFAPSAFVIFHETHGFEADEGTRMHIEQKNSSGSVWESTKNGLNILYILLLIYSPGYDTL